MDCIFHGVTKSQTQLSNFHASLPWTSLSPRVCSDLCLLSWWCHDLWTITTWQIAPMWFHHLSIDHHLMRGKLNALCLFSRQLCMNTYITADCFFFLTFTCQLCYLAIRDADFCAFHIFYSHWHHWVFVFVYTSIEHFFFLLLFLGRYTFLLRPQARHTILIWLQHRIFLKYWKLMTSYHIVQ